MPLRRRNETIGAALRRRAGDLPRHAVGDSQRDPVDRAAAQSGPENIVRVDRGLLEPEVERDRPVDPEGDPSFEGRADSRVAVERFERRLVGRGERSVVGVEVVEEDRGPVVRSDERGIADAIAVTFALARHESPKRSSRFRLDPRIREAGRDSAD